MFLTLNRKHVLYYLEENMSTRTLGIQFPLQDDLAQNRLFAMDTTARQSLKSQLLFLLVTPLGSRWYQQDFGTNLAKYLFEPNNGITWDQIINEINVSVSKYIPNLSVVKMTNRRGDSDYSLILDVHYVYTEEYYSESDAIEVVFNG